MAEQTGGLPRHERYLSRIGEEEFLRQGAGEDQRVQSACPIRYKNGGLRTIRGRHRLKVHRLAREPDKPSRPGSRYVCAPCGIRHGSSDRTAEH